jgi:hypothetical protein
MPIQHNMLNMVMAMPVAEPKNFRKSAPVYPISAAISSPSMIITLDRSIGFRKVRTMASESVGYSLKRIIRIRINPSYITARKNQMNKEIPKPSILFSCFSAVAYAMADILKHKPIPAKRISRKSGRCSEAKIPFMINGIDIPAAKLMERERASPVY